MTLNGKRTHSHKGTSDSLTRPKSLILPALVVNAGLKASERFVEFFTAHIRNPNTRRAYGRAAWTFFAWANHRGLTLTAMTPVDVAAWLENLTAAGYETASVKQQLAAVRMLLDYLATGGVLEHNPSLSVKGPRHSVRRGKTPVLDGAEAGKLLKAIPTDTIVGLRDRALIGLMTYTFARIGAATGMTVADVYHERNRLWVRLSEKGGKRHEMPCHHALEDYLTSYIDAAGLLEQPSMALFRSIDRRTKKLGARRLTQAEAWQMVNRRAEAAGIKTAVCNHTFRGTGITTYLENGGVLERAQVMANHASTKTTQLYDRRNDRLTLDDIERIRLK